MYSQSMNTCGTCKYFGVDRKGMRPGADTTESIYIPAPYKVCGFMEMEPTDAVACVVDGSGFYAALCVSEDFGCNQWAPP